MTVQIKNIIEPTPLTTAAVTLYTSENVSTIIDKLTVSNVNGAAQTYSVHLVSAGQTASDANTIVKDKTVFAGGTDTCFEAIGHTLDQGDFIAVSGSVADDLSIRASGRLVSI